MQKIPKITGSRLLLTIIDVTVLLIMLIFGTGGMIWLSNSPYTIGCIYKNPIDLDKISKEKARLGQLKYNYEDLKNRLSDANSRTEQLKKSLDELKKPDIERCRVRYKQVKQKVKNLQLEIDRIQELISTQVSHDKALAREKNRVIAERKEIAEASERLKEAKKRKYTLTKQISALKPRKEIEKTIKIDSTPLAKIIKGKYPVYIGLIKGTVTPIREPYYEKDYEIRKKRDGEFESVLKFSRKKLGQPIEKIESEESELKNILREIKRETQYVALLVDNSSFDTFRYVRKVLIEEKIPFGWEPSTESTLWFTAGGQRVFLECE